MWPGRWEESVYSAEDTAVWKDNGEAGIQVLGTVWNWLEKLVDLNDSGNSAVMGKIWGSQLFLENKILNSIQNLTLLQNSENT